MKTIKLSQGKEAIVDDETYEWAKNYKWFASRNGPSRMSPRMGNGKRVPITLHHCIIGFPLNGFFVVHINGNKLDCRKCNLQFSTNRKDETMKRQNRKRYNANWREENTEWRKVYAATNRTKINYRYLILKSCAKRKSLEMNISLPQYFDILQNSCFYCCADISQESGHGLDRIDNNQGYLIDNVVPCCKICNLGRGSRFSSKEWKLAIDTIINFRKTNT